VIRLTGLPGLSPPWRFLSNTVIASCLYRSFGIQTFPDLVTISSDRRCCDVELSSRDATFVLRRVNVEGDRILLHHRDERIQSLNMTAHALKGPSIAEQLAQRGEASWSAEWQRLMDEQGAEATSSLHPSWLHDDPAPIPTTAVSQLETIDPQPSPIGPRALQQPADIDSSPLSSWTDAIVSPELTERAPGPPISKPVSQLRSFLTHAHAQSTVFTTLSLFPPL
jgi:hypothetical protein